MIHSSTLGFSPRLPVSVYGTGSLRIQRVAAFLGSRLPIYISASVDLEYYQLSASSADLPTKPIPTAFNELFRQFASVSLLRHHIAVIESTGILTSYPSASPFGYTLGPD